MPLQNPDITDRKPKAHTVRIYVACLAAYNSGRLHGVWIDCFGKGAEEIKAEVGAMLKASPEPGAEDWAIHDYESPVPIGEYTSFDDVALIQDALERAPVGFAYLVGDCGMNIRDAAERCEDVLFWQGTAEDYVFGTIQECYTDQELGLFASYIDYNRIAHDWRIDGAFSEFEFDGSHHIIANPNEF